jgi:hypothetical protein
MAKAAAGHSQDAPHADRPGRCRCDASAPETFIGAFPKNLVSPHASCMSNTSAQVVGKKPVLQRSMLSEMGRSPIWPFEESSLLPDCTPARLPT